MPGSPSTPGDSLEAPFAVLTRLFTQILPTSDSVQPHAVAWALVWSAWGVGTAWLVMRLVRAGALPPLCSPTVVGCLAASAAYVVVYSRDGEVQLWYATSFLVPCSLLLAALGRGAFGRHVLIPGIVLATVAASVSTVTLTWVPYPHQIALLRAGIALRDEPAGHTVGAWDAGIIGFTSDRGVVNLDGLVNDDAAAYVLRGDLAAYVRHRELTDIIDYRSMVDSEWSRVRGGYADGRLIACLGAPTASFDGGGLDAEHTVVLRPVRPGCP